jgi:phage pi2 protein 07
MSSSSSHNQISGSGYLISTDPNQKRDGYYRVMKTNNAAQSLLQMNLVRAKKDIECVAFFTCTDLAKVEVLVKPAIKNKLVAGSTDWVYCPDEKSVEKLKVTIETLVDIGNES